ncbi:MAG: CRISPR-associated helicase/endonuclease Cas3, partial [Chloroflexi bacterium]|nr:CRISPR-associated helicase/endonuclease Cas3 [Chloroflexota bacterium]
DYSWPEPDERIAWPELAAKLAKAEQVLAVVDRRKDARELARELQKVSQNPVFHLSALMCPAHRLDVINRIKESLKQGVVCRVVSTQLVEAGVDLDFPAVYRSLTGLSSIIQAAGRCNREGRLTKGKVIVFRSPFSPPDGTLKSARDITESMLREAGTLDPNDLATVEKFFRQLYFTQNLDVLGIQTERQEFNFATVGQRFHLIEDGFTKNIIVPFDDSSARLEDFRHYGADRQILRSLQPYSVSVYPDAFEKLNDSGALVEVNGIFALSPTHSHLYDPVFGLVEGDENPLPVLMV